MEGSVHSYLKFIAFPEFNLWDVKAYTSKKITSKFPLVKLNNLGFSLNNIFIIFAL
jgi:hypothetical protein